MNIAPLARYGSDESLYEPARCLLELEETNELAWKSSLIKISTVGKIDFGAAFSIKKLLELPRGLREKY